MQLKRKQILITNDDGITASGIVRLAEAAKAHGDVWVIAPEGERSAASHSITLRDPIDLRPHSFPVEGVRAYACSGTPADCIRVGGLSVMPERPDVVLSGINYGYNVASDIQYSATVGAAFEASFQGYGAIAFSEAGCSCHEVSDRYLAEILAEWIGAAPKAGWILNVNFPGCPLGECKGVLLNRRVSRSAFYRDKYREIAALPGGGRRYLVDGIYQEEAEEETDMRAVLDGYVSIGFVNNVGF